jgi:hypothetical protein
VDKHESMRRKKEKRRRKRLVRRVVVYEELVLTQKGLDWLEANGYIEKLEVSNGES